MIDLFYRKSYDAEYLSMLICTSFLLYTTRGKLKGKKIVRTKRMDEKKNMNMHAHAFCKLRRLFHRSCRASFT